MSRSDVVVLGAGIVGVSVALHLQARGRSVVLLDRKAPGEETSFGNAGIIERASVIPYTFPREIPDLFRYALNRSTDARYDPLFVPRVAPWLYQFWRASSPGRLKQIVKDLLPLIENCLSEHKALMAKAGIDALRRDRGWIEFFRRPRSFDKAVAEARALEAYKLRYAVLDPAALHALEPHLAQGLVGAVHWQDPATVTDPGKVVKAYADLFVRQGGILATGDARSLEADGDGWRVMTGSGPVEARDAVIALGPWANDLYRSLGYAIPMAVKRGYHMHYRPAGGAVANHTMLDVDGGYLMAPMERGLRLTTGVEFADRDAPPTPIQVDRAEAKAREIFPLGERVDPAPWMGRRPCLPDMKPVLGPAPRHKGLWFAFGHNHHGLTLGPVTGRLLAQMMTGETPFTDPAPYRADRF
ncbi:FAD-binding oxidoreductase [Oleomonas cavernae]|uniref:FAD-binding oxidoreductase n=1 Tax=Oleomonas cavernae TaxID=2320859 RepID=A0A418VUA7_9PROT|nr:FAD-binding oxidoreductase [Oleomonas cavernae]RJF80741.1 FAD-binding oxidoreductase [Oleomonas cavernae]